MLDMGFIRDIRRVLDLVPAKRQSLLFSATFSDDDATARRGVARRPGERRGDAPQYRRPSSSARSSTRSTVAQARAAQPPHPERPHRAGAGLHADEARREPPRRAAPAGRHRGDRDPRQQEPGPARVRALGRLQGRPGDDPRRHRSRLARASTSTRCRTSSTSSCRWSPRTTSTGSAGPAEPGRRATRSRSSASTSRVSSARSRRSSGKRIPSEVIQGFEPDRSIRPEPIRRGQQGPRQMTAAADADRRMAPSPTGTGSGRSSRFPHRAGRDLGPGVIQASAGRQKDRAYTKLGGHGTRIGNAATGTRPPAGAPAHRRPRRARSGSATRRPFGDRRPPVEAIDAVARRTTVRPATSRVRRAAIGPCRANACSDRTPAADPLPAAGILPAWTPGSCSSRTTRRSARSPRSASATPGFEVDTAADGQAGLERFRARRTTSSCST